MNRLLFTCEIYYMHHLHILHNSAYVLFKLILKLSDEFEIMLST